MDKPFSLNLRIYPSVFPGVGLVSSAPWKIQNGTLDTREYKFAVVIAPSPTGDMGAAAENNQGALFTISYTYAPPFESP
jgi:hypothetical protein